MKAWLVALVGMVVLAEAGCRTDPRIELLERENRKLEDEIYRLREYVEDYQVALEGRAGETSVSPGIVGGVPRRSTPSPPPPPQAQSEAPAAATTQPPVVELPGEPQREVPGTLMPRTPSKAPGRSQGPGPSEVPSPPSTVPETAPTFPNLPGEPDAPGAPASKSPDEPGLLPRQALPGPVSLRLGEDGAAAPPAPENAAPTVLADSQQVTQIVLDQRLTGGYDADGRPGDEGIRALVGPRDCDGQPVDAPADIAVVLLDSELPGEAARVARWDFTAAQTAGLFRGSGSSRGIELRMPWPAARPSHEKLHLFVRYTTSDGRKLELNQPLRINLSDRSAGWVPAEPLKPDPEVNRPAEPSASLSSPPIGRRGEQSPHLATRPTVQPPPDDRPKAQRPVWSPYRR